MVLALVPAVAPAHELPVNRMVNAIARVDGTRAELVARIPMDLMHGAAFPIAGGRYDLAQVAPWLALSSALLADAFVLSEDGTRLAPLASSARLVPAEDRSFDSLAHARRATAAPVDPSVAIPVDTGYLELHESFRIVSDRSRFEIRSQVAIDAGVLAPLTIRFERGDDAVRAMIVAGGAGPVDLDPAWYRAAASFVGLGVEHILSGTDHLLFLLCLVVPVRRVRAIVPVVTGFTVAHSLTLIGSALGLVPTGAWFAPLVEAAIAASIVYTAIENVLGRNVSRRWLVACLFGLVHGFGFSSALGDALQFAGRHLLVSLLAFNVGIEAGQLGVLCLAWPLLVLLRRVASPRVVTVGASALGIVVGGVWLVERWQVLQRLGAGCGAAACTDAGVIGGAVLVGIAAWGTWWLRAASRGRAGGRTQEAWQHED